MGTYDALIDELKKDHHTNPQDIHTFTNINLQILENRELLNLIYELSDEYKRLNPNGIYKDMRDDPADLYYNEKNSTDYKLRNLQRSILIAMIYLLIEMIETR